MDFLPFVLTLESAGWQHRAGKKGGLSSEWPGSSEKPPNSLFWDVCVVEMTEMWIVTRMKYLNVFPHFFKDAIELLNWLDCKGHITLQLNFKTSYIIFYCLQYSNQPFCTLVTRNLVNLTWLNVLLSVIRYLVSFCYMRWGYKWGSQMWLGKRQKAGRQVL